jgi:hypothetical protein
LNIPFHGISFNVFFNPGMFNLGMELKGARARLALCERNTLAALCEMSETVW